MQHEFGRISNSVGPLIEILNASNIKIDRDRYRTVNMAIFDYALSQSLIKYLHLENAHLTTFHEFVKEFTEDSDALRFSYGDNAAAKLNKRTDLFDNMS